MAAAINSIKANYEALRDKSKGPTFANQYEGTWRTLVRSAGFPADEAKAIVANYHEMYKASRAWTAERIKEASEQGYVTGAFGLRVRTPLLQKTILGSKNAPYEAVAEGRTAGNALGQSYCLLNNRAGNEFMERVWASPYALDILPVAQIHDALYFLIRDKTEVVEWVNNNLIECMQWQEDPAIAHDTVKVGAELDVFYGSWDQPIKIPNNATPAMIRTACVRGAKEYNKPK